MGVNRNTLKLVKNVIVELDITRQESSLALIGNLVMRNLARQKASEYFRKTWKEALSFDISGNADIDVDLCQPIYPTYHDHFDLLINGGTAEHVEDQQMFFDNCHLMVKPGGALIHVVPEVGSFRGHSPFGYAYDLHFFVEYVVKYGYRLFDLKRISHGRYGYAIYATLLYPKKEKQE